MKLDDKLLRTIQRKELKIDIAEMLIYMLIHVLQPLPITELSVHRFQIICIIHKCIYHRFITKNVRNYFTHKILPIHDLYNTTQRKSPPHSC